MENLEKQKEIDEYISKIKRLEKENDKLWDLKYFQHLTIKN
jgi:uncharacterized protein (UPF0335 family)